MEALQQDVTAGDFFNDGKGRSLPGQVVQEPGDCALFPLQLQSHTGRGVADVPVQAIAAHQAVNKGPKAHPLDNAFDFHFHSLHGSIPSVAFHLPIMVFFWSCYITSYNKSMVLTSWILEAQPCPLRRKRPWSEDHGRPLRDVYDAS